MPTETKAYLGDAVYARLTPLGDVVLTTEDGIQATNTIVLEPATLANLLAWHAVSVASADVTVSARCRTCHRQWETTTRPADAEAASARMLKEHEPCTGELSVWAFAKAAP